MSADRFQLKRGTTAQVNAYLPAIGEPVYDTTTKQLKIGDGIAFGGNPIATSLTANKLTTARNIALAGSVVGTVAFDGSADVSITTSVGTSLQSTLDSKATLASPTLTGVPLSTTPAVGTNTTQIATAAMIQAEIANKRTWTAYTPTITPTTGTFTSISATGKYMVAFGICHIQVYITVTTLGTGTKPIFTLPFPALAGSAGAGLPAHEANQNGKTGTAQILAGLTTASTKDYNNADLATANGCFIIVTGSYPIA